MKEIVVFTPPDLGPVLEAFDDAGWINLQPEVADIEEEDRPGYFGVFGSRGPVVPFATWHAGDRSAGIQHGTGPKVARRVEVPAGWRVVQDHPKRGLVVRVPAGVGTEEVLRWLLVVGEQLCPAPLLGRWVAEVHT